MSLSKEDSRFWSLAEKYGIIEVSPVKNLATVNAAEVPVKVVKHVTENAFTVMEDIFVLKEKRRQLEHKKSINCHSARSRSLNKMFDSSSIMIEKMNNELESILHKKYVILSLLQNATLKKDTIPIPVNLHRTFIKLLEGLVELCNIKMSVAECFFKLSGINWDKSLQELRPLKLQMLRTISIYGKQLYDVCELRNSLNEMLLSTTEFAPSFLYDLDASV